MTKKFAELREKMSPESRARAEERTRVILDESADFMVERPMEKTGDVILSRKPATWDDFFIALKGSDVPADFLNEKERNQGAQDRDPFDGLSK